MTVHTKDLWRLALHELQVDPDDLIEAIQDQVVRNDLDFRSRLLIRDSLDALRKYWGLERLLDRLSTGPVREQIESIWREDLGAPGFSLLMRRVMETTRPETIRQFFRALGVHLRRPLRLQVGGSAALILPGYLSRRTEDVDVVDEIPTELRKERKLLKELEERFSLKLAHFQQHYLPAGWAQRVHSLEPFGQLQVSLVDVYDVFLSKLFSIRTKDFDDLRMLTPQLDKETVIRKLKDTTGSMLAEAKLRQRAEKNWYILFGEPLPS